MEHTRETPIGRWAEFGDIGSDSRTFSRTFINKERNCSERLITISIFGHQCRRGYNASHSYAYNGGHLNRNDINYSALLLRYRYLSKRFYFRKSLINESTAVDFQPIVMSAQMQITDMWCSGNSTENNHHEDHFNFDMHLCLRVLSCCCRYAPPF